MTLTLTCPKCTKSEAFNGIDRAKCIAYAIKRGWKMAGGQCVCKKCPA